MKKKFVVAHRVDVNNVGDMASEPLQYFLPREEYDVIDVTDRSNCNWHTDLPLIVGGGGLFGNDYIGDVCESILTLPDRHRLQDIGNQTWKTNNSKFGTLARKFNDDLQDLVARTLERIPTHNHARFIWGAGHNSDSVGDDRVKYGKYLSEYRMVGLRDWHGIDSRYRWVPCASCLHPAFDQDYDIRNDVIWFEHKKGLFKDFGDDSIPRFVNSGNNIDQTIELLASARVILTNSYHGAYWGTLLGRRVIVVDAWSTKFHFFRHSPFLLNSRKQRWQDIVDEVPVYTEALQECRRANRDFWQELIESITRSTADPGPEPDDPSSDTGDIESITRSTADPGPEPDDPSSDTGDA